LRKTILVSLILSLLAGFVGPVHAQAKDEVRRSLDQARNLERLSKYEEALQIHMRLFAANPDNKQALDGIERDLLQLKRYDELKDILGERLQARPDDASVVEKLGMAEYKSGDEAKARQMWQTIIERNPDRQDSYMAVARQYLYNGLVDDAAVVYLAGRKRLGDANLFARELANLYSSQARYGEATAEYVLLLEDAKQYSYVESMIGRFKRTAESDNQVLQALRDAVGKNPDNAQLRRLLGGHCLRTEHPDEALEQFSRVEELEGTNGAALLDFGDWSNREGFPSTALKAYERLLELFPESPLGPKAYQGLGQSLEKMGLHQEAIAAFRILASRYARSREADYALFEIGKIYLHRLANPDSALDAFHGLTAGSGRQSRYASEAKSLIAECYFVKGDLVGAEQQYEQLRQETADTPELAQEAAFRVAEMRYFRGDFDGALQELETLTKGSPSGVFVNDALDLMVFIEEHRSFGDDALKAFAIASVLERQGKAGEAITAFQRLPTYYPQSLLGDDALLRIGGLYKIQGDFSRALEAYRSILSQYPDSDQGDEVQRRTGEIYEEDLQDIPKAIEAYEQMLSSYPKSLLFDPVRKRVRELQERLGPTG